MKEFEEILSRVKADEISIEEGIRLLRRFFYADLGFAKVDTHREARVGYPEVIFCQGKTVSQIVGIIAFMLKTGANILATRASEEIHQAVSVVSPDAEYNPLARTIVIRRKKVAPARTSIAVVTAGTSDMPVAEEAAVTAELLGNTVSRIIDVGVAGIHRLFDSIEEIRRARVVVVVAGMEGALASVVGGLVDKPLVAVPTSVGYGANFGGLSALLSMLNSCASGVSVVNIDNGFGAGYLASMINRLE